MKLKDRIKKAIICKHVTDYTINRLNNRTYVPRAGDVAIFRVLEIGKHKAIQGDTGKNRYIFPGDLIMATFGNRYASNQFEGYVPDGYQEEYEILGQGGVVGKLTSMHLKMQALGATRVKLVGYAMQKGRVVNTQYLTEEPVSFDPNRMRKHKIILSLGSSMDSGKTTSAAYLCRGLRNAGHQVGFIKLTGTVFSRDKHFVHDCGAHKVVDFSNLGFPSTYMYEMQELLDIFAGLSRKVEAIDPDYIVVEIADGLLQRETSMLLHNPAFRSVVDHVLLSCGDSLSVQSGLEFLARVGLQPFAISGLINASPLMVEEVRQTVALPVLGLEHLSDRRIVRRLRHAMAKIA
ncbi:MAG: hypothetical protein AAF998_15580 [Bacteroidota bacterium]